MPTNINFNKRLGVSGGTNITLPSGAFSSGKSFQFDGVNDYFEGVGNYTELNGQNNFTFSFWIKPTNLNNSKIVFSIGNGASDTRAQQFFVTYFSTGQIIFYLNSIGSLARTNGGAVTANVWQHILICRDSSAAIGSKVKIFVNAVDSTSYENTRYWTNSTPATTGLMIGEHTNSYHSPFLGNINELAIWSGTDQRANIAEIYNGGEPNDLNTLPTAPQPTTWQRMGDNAVWDGSKFVMTDVNGGYVNTSIGLLPTDPNPSTDVPLFDNKSFTYDGVNDYFEGLSTYSELNGQNKATFSIWIKPTYASAKFGILFHVPRNTQTARSQFLCFLDTNNRIRWSMTSLSTYVYSNTSVITLNQWNHILICVDLTSTDKAKIFINGDDETSLVNLSASQFDTSSGSLLLAEEAKGYLDPFDGDINEFAIWSGSDLRNDAAQIYNNGVGSNLNLLPTSPTTYLRGEFVTFDGTNWTTIDQGSETNNSTSVSMPLTSRTSDVPT